MLTGKGMFVWKIRDCEGGSFVEIARAAAQAGFSHVLIKIADGAYPYNIGNKVDLVPAAVAALRGAGVEQIWGWHYVYAVDPMGEAKIAVERTHALGLDGYVIDAEDEYKGRGAAAVMYADYLRKNMRVPIALSSYRFPALHPEFPFREFLRRVDVNMPQVYWMGARNAGEQLKKCVAQYRVLAPDLPIVPTGASFHQDGWTSLPNEIVEFSEAAKALKMPAINFWEWGHARRYQLWDTVAGLDWGSQPEEPQEPDPTVPEPEPAAGLAFEVLVDGLNVRSGPGREYADLDDLRRGQVVRALAVAGREAWVKIGENPDRWTCVQLGSTQFLRVKES